MINTIKPIAELKAWINEHIKSNHERGITGANLNTALIDTIDSLESSSDSKVADCVKYTSQTKTTAEKTIARQNIGAQETLVAGAGISIAPDGKTISATGSSSSWTLLRSYTVEEASPQLDCYDVLNDGSAAAIRVIFTMPSVEGMQIIRPYVGRWESADKYFYNITRYTENAPYSLDFMSECGYIYESGQYPYNASDCRFIGDSSTPIRLKEHALDCILIRLYEGTFPVGTSVKVYKK